jgi:hypothetical protein
MGARRGPVKTDRSYREKTAAVLLEEGLFADVSQARNETFS